MSFDKYSETPASNYVTPYWVVGMAPSSVKVAGSNVMADLASRFAAIHTSSGSANAHVVNQTQQWASLIAGLELLFIPGNANTGATTLAVDGLTAKNIFTNGAACVGGELKTGQPALVKYDGTQFNLINPANIVFATNLQNGNYTYAATSGTNTITASLSPAIAAYANGQEFSLKIANTTTGTATLNINSIGALNLYYSDGTTQLLPGALIATNIYNFIYDSSLNSSAGGFICINPSDIVGSFTITLTGMTAGTTGTVNYSIGNDGKIVFVRPGTIAGISNTATMTGTGIPTILESTSNRNIILLIEDNAVVTWGTMNGINGTTWTYTKNGIGSNFTTSGTKGLPINEFSYSLY